MMIFLRRKTKRLLSLHLLVMSVTITNLGFSKATEIQYEDFPQLVRSQNQAVKAAALMSEAKERRIGSLTQTFSPTITGTLGTEHFKTGTFEPLTQPSGSIEASVNVYRGGRDELELNAQRDQASMAKAEGEIVWQEELLQVRDLYWQLVAYKETLRLWKEAEKLNGKNRKAAERRVSRGLASNSDLLSFDLFGQKISEAMEIAQHEMGVVEMELRTRLQLKDDQINVKDGVPHDHDDGLLKTADNVETHPAVAALKAETSYHRSLSQASFAAWQPKVDLFAAYGLSTFRDRAYSDSDDRQDWSVGVRASVNLFDRQLSRREAQSESLQAQSKGELASYKKNLIETSLKKTQEEMKHLHELIHGSEKYLSQGQKLLSQTLSEYDRGLKSSQDVLSTIERLIDLRTQDLERRHAYQKVKTHLQANMGT